MTKQDAPPHGFRRMLSVARVGDAGLVQTIDVGKQDRERIAQYLELPSIESLTAEVTLARWRGKGVKVTGTFKADVTQACVVTLDPLTAHVEAAFERRFTPQDDQHANETPQEIFVDPQGDDPPEPLPRDIDLGEILVEELSLNLDPYPRKPGVELQSAGETTPPRQSPFAVLAKLKPKPTRTD